MSRTALRVHSVPSHMQDTVVVLEEVNTPLPRCPHCDMFIPREALNGQHPTTEMCAKGSKNKYRQQVEEEMHVDAAAAFQAYRRNLVAVNSFKYLGFLTTSIDDWPEVLSHLSNSRRNYERFYRIMVREGEYKRTTRTFYKAVIQATLLFISETWVMTPTIGWTLGSFHHRVAH